MTMAYKLTNKEMRTHGGLQWSIGVPIAVPPGGVLCGPNCIHTYSHPLLAALFNPIHGNFCSPRLFRCECEGTELTDKGLKSGWTDGTVTLVNELPLPDISTNARVRCAIYCVQAVIGDRCPAWSTWAARWLSGDDRSADAAREAAAAATDAAREAAAAATDVAWVAARAARVAARAAREAAWAAREAAWAARDAAAAARDAAAAARDAAAAAREAAWAAGETPIDFVAIIERASWDEAADEQ